MVACAGSSDSLLKFTVEVLMFCGLRCVFMHRDVFIVVVSQNENIVLFCSLGVLVDLDTLFGCFWGGFAINSPDS